MELVSSPELTICGISELPDQRARNVTHVLSLLDPEHPDIDVFQSYGAHRRTTMRFHDIIDERPGMRRPVLANVTDILAFGEDFLASRDAAGPSHLLVHCHMGVSRSTAAMVTLMAQASPDEGDDVLFARLLAIRPQAWPNSQMVVFADDLLGRKGGLVAALRRHYGRQLNAQPRYRDWMADLGRQAEVDMAVTP